MTFEEIIKFEQEKEYFKSLQKFLDDAYKNNVCYPPVEQIYNAFSYCDYEDVKVVILGQDPYHEPLQANGLAFSVSKEVKIPPSLVNMYKEACDDVGIEMPTHGDLSSWASQGVLLMNTVMSVEAHKANSHKNKGWEQFTDAVIASLDQREKPLVFILWGSAAIKKESMIDTNKHLVIKSVHPSPLSSYRGFFGSKPYSTANNFLISNGITPIDWSIK